MQEGGGGDSDRDCRPQRTDVSVLARRNLRQNFKNLRA